MLNISIVIPVFNEKDNIKNLLMEIFNAGIKQKFEIILVNDGSTDEYKCYKLIKENYDNIILINNSSNFGQSYSIHSGINKAKYNSIVTLDADGQNDPKDINTLIEIMKIILL